MAGAKRHPDTERAIRLVLDGGAGVTEAAAVMGIHRTTLSRALNSKKKKKVKK